MADDPSSLRTPDRLGVLFLQTPTAEPLGADNWVHVQIADRLDRATHRVASTCVPTTAGRPTPLARALARIDDIDVIPVPPGPGRPRSRTPAAFARVALDGIRSVASLARLVRIVRRDDVRIVHAADRPRDAVMCVILGRLTPARSVLHVHVKYGDWMSGPLRWALRTAHERVAVSDFVRRSLVDAGHDGETTHTVLNGIRPGDWTADSSRRREVRASLGLDDDSIVVVTVCRLFAEKGTQELIRAVPELASVDARVHLLIVGADRDPAQSYRRVLDELVTDLGVAERVTFTGQRDDVADLMASADVFAMPSFEEPFGLVFCEAMAMGLPVVALDSGGAPEIISHGVHGLLPPPDHHDALVSGLAMLISEPGRRRAMGEEGRRHVERHFDVDRMASDMAALYREVAR